MKHLVSICYDFGLVILSRVVSMDSHLYVGVLPLRSLCGERQIQEVHQVVTAVSMGLKAVICLNHLEYTCWDIGF